MPNPKLEWNSENFSQVIQGLYSEVVTDSTLRDQLMADPFTVLNERIELPDEFRGKVIAQNRTDKILVLNVPAHGNAPRTVAGTTDATETPDFLMCTVITEW